MSSGPNPFVVAWSVLRAQRVSRPQPTGSGVVNHDALTPILDALRAEGVSALADLRPDLERYRTSLAAIGPNTLSRDEALAYWLNLYNAGALSLAAEAAAAAETSVLGVPGGFSRPWVIVVGEELSLNAIEHGKIRRFKDPRIHGSLVCGSASCPTLRYEPFTGGKLDHQLDDQMRSFLGGGGAVVDDDAGVLYLSRVFLWYGADFVRPHRMPAWIPPSKPAITAELEQWLDGDVRQWMLASSPKIVFQPYDWSLACTIR